MVRSVRCVTSTACPDILINNAGFAVYRTFEQSSSDEIERLLRVNFAGHVLVTKEVLDGMIDRGSGHIVNIASVAGLFNVDPERRIRRFEERHRGLDSCAPCGAQSLWDRCVGRMPWTR